MLTTALISNLYELPDTRILRQTFGVAKERLEALGISQIGYELKLQYCNRSADTNPATWDAVELLVRNKQQTSYKTRPGTFIEFIFGLGFAKLVLLDCPEPSAYASILSIYNALPQVSFFTEPYQHCIATNDPRFGNKDCDIAARSKLLIPTYDLGRLVNYSGHAKAARWYPLFDPDSRTEILETLKNYDRIVYSNKNGDSDVLNTQKQDFRDFCAHGLLAKVIPLGTIDEICSMVDVAKNT